MICHDIAPFKADCQTFKELFARDGITLHLEINSANYALFIGRNEQLFAVVETGHFAYVITKLSKVGCNYGADNLDCIEDDIALSEVRNDPSFEMISENYYWLSYEFKFRGHTYTYGQYLDHEYQRAITCVDTKKTAFIFTDDESEAFADSKGYDIHDELRNSISAFISKFKNCRSVPFVDTISVALNVHIHEKSFRLCLFMQF